MAARMPASRSARVPCSSALALEPPKVAGGDGGEGGHPHPAPTAPTSTVSPPEAAAKLAAPLAADGAVEEEASVEMLCGAPGTRSSGALPSGCFQALLREPEAASRALGGVSSPGVELEAAE